MSGMDWNEIEHLPKAETEPGKVGLILDRGWRVGKKIVIAGVVISSVPIVLPPLMLFSALGFAFAVPFGLVFTGYACTHKIMRSLLSSPLPPPLEEEELEGIAVGEELEWEKVVREVVEDREEEYENEPITEEEKGRTGDVDEIEDGKEIRRDGEEKDVREIVEDDERRLNVRAVEGDEEKIEGEEFEYEEGPIIEEEKRRTDDVDENEDGKEIRQDKEGEDVKEIVGDDESRLDVTAVEKDKETIEDEGLAYEKEPITDEIEVGEEIRRNEKEENVREVFEDDKSRLDVRAVEKDKEKIEDEELEYEKEPTTEEEKQKTNDVDEIEISVEIQWDGEGNGEGKEEIVTAIIEDDGSGLDAGETKNDNQVREREDLSEMTRDGEGGLDIGKIKGDEVQGEENVKVIIEDDESRFDVREMEKDEKVQEENVSRFDVGEMKKDEKAQEGENVKEIAEDDDSRVPSVVIISTVEKENGVPEPYTPGTDETDEDSGQMTVPGSVAPLENKVDSDPSRLPSEYSSGTKGKSSDHDMDAQRVDSTKHSDASSKPITGVASETKTHGSPPDEVLYTEVEIWEQIDAMRTIVGYSAALHASYIEELKALYVFTGVEPPITFKDPSDLAEVSDKLRFLKSVVGVK